MELCLLSEICPSLCLKTHFFPDTEGPTESDVLTLLLDHLDNCHLYGLKDCPLEKRGLEPRPRPLPLDLLRPNCLHG